MVNLHPLVSVITPTYNSEKYLNETANSVIKQSYSNWEWIVVDDCSIDSTRKILENLSKTDSRIKPLFLNKNCGGPAKPRNIGLENAKGKYICFLDSDDVWLKNKIETQLENINDADAICSNFSIIDENSKRVKENNPYFSEILFRVSLHRHLIWYFNPININTSMIKNNTHIRFNENREFAAIEDWIFWIDYLSDNKNFKYIKDATINYRVHKDSISSWDSINSYKKIINFLNFAIKENRLNRLQLITAKFAVYFKIFLRRVKIFFKNGE